MDIKWTLCEEQTPIKEGIYLVSVYDDSYEFDIPCGVVIAFWSCGQWYKNSLWNVYAWAELPAPAKKDGFKNYRDDE